VVQTRYESDTMVLTLEGRMDTPTCEQSEPDILGRIREAKGPVVLDMHGVDYVSSMFLRLCLKAAQQVGPGNFSIVQVSPEIKKVFKIAGFDQQNRIN